MTTYNFNYYLDRPQPTQSPYKKLVLDTWTAPLDGDLVYHNIYTREKPQQIPDLWRLVRGKLHLVCCATVANRRLMALLVTNFGQSSEQHGIQTAFITASEDHEFFWTIDTGLKSIQTEDVLVQGDEYSPIGGEFIASYPDYFLLRSYGTRGTDVVSGWATFEYMNYRLGLY